jgi:hypothetical protein
MDPTAFSLDLGILVFVLSYSCVGMGWIFSLPIALGTTIAVRIAHQVLKHRKHSGGTTSSVKRLLHGGEYARKRAQSLEALKT